MDAIYHGDIYWCKMENVENIFLKSFIETSIKYWLEIDKI